MPMFQSLPGFTCCICAARKTNISLKINNLHLHCQFRQIVIVLAFRDEFGFEAVLLRII